MLVIYKVHRLHQRHILKLCSLLVDSLQYVYEVQYSPVQLKRLYEEGETEGTRVEMTDQKRINASSFGSADG